MSEFNTENEQSEDKKTSSNTINRENVKKNSAQPSIISQNDEKVNRKNAETPPNWVYSDIVKEHFLSPRNFLMGDEANFPHDAAGTVGNPICGDQMTMFIRVKAGKIADVKWKTYGCASAIASTSALSELVKGRTLEDALTVGPEEIAQYLGGLPKHKFHCSVLGHEALAAAIADFRAKSEQ